MNHRDGTNHTEAVRQLFDELVELPSEARAERLAALDDAALRRELVSLFDAYDGADRTVTELEALRDLLSSQPSDTDPHQLVGQRIRHYEITEFLGRGGMGVVYKARDTKLGRPVALKFLPPPLSANVKAKRRFRREAQAASALDHPNIGTIYEIGETETGRLFIAMACYEGETLKEKIDRGPLPVDEAIDYARQLARGLAKAHAAGIVHRDVKPANVMVTEDGYVKLLDFGLAKLGNAHLTQTGRTLGTVAYLSPKQARGEAVDRRTDLWSLGVLFYEMLTGERPFRGAHPQAVIYSILNEEAPSVRQHRGAVPEALAQIVEALLQKELDARYSNASELEDDLRSLGNKSLSTEHRLFRIPPSKPTRRAAAAFGSAVVLVLVGVLGGVLWPRFYASQRVDFEQRDWLLVADVENLTGDSLFDHALDRVLTTGIQQSGYVNVFPRSRVNETLQRMGRTASDTLNEATIREVAIRANLDGVLIPSISRVGERFALTARLLHPPTGAELDAVAVQATGEDGVLDALDRLTRQIRQSLGESLESVRESSVYLPAATTSSLQALRSFADGNRAWDGGRYDDAFALFERAVERDSAFAWAHVMLGNYYYFFGNNPSAAETHYATATAELDRLPERERLWLQAHMEGYRGNREVAVRTLKTYVERYPDDRDAWYNLGSNYMRMDRYDEALNALHQALEIDPNMASAYANLATTHNAAGRLTEAVEHYKKAFNIQPEWITGTYLNYEYGHSYLALDEPDEAEKVFRLMLDEPERWKHARGKRSLALLAIYRGHYGEAVNLLHEAAAINHLEEGRHLSELRDHLFLANIHLMKGQRSRAANELEAIEAIWKAEYVGPVFLQLCGDLYLRMEQMEQAEELLTLTAERAREENETDQAALSLFEGEIAVAQGDNDAALSALRRAVYFRDNALYKTALAQAYERSGRLEEARDVYTAITTEKAPVRESLAPWILARYRLGRVYERMNQFDQAMHAYESFLDFWRTADPDLLPVSDAKKRLERLQNRSRRET